MRLAIVSREFPPVTDYTGGIGHQYARLAPELARQGHEVHVITVAREQSAYRHLDGMHVHMLREPQPSGPLAESRGMIGRALQVDRLLSTAGPWDVVYGAEWRGEMARHALRRDRAPVITNLATSLAKVHEAGRGDSRRVGLRTGIQRALERGQTEHSQAIVAPSRAILAWSRDNWDIERIHSRILPNMIDVAGTRELARGSLGHESPSGTGEPTILFFGRLEPVKGVDVLVQAMAEVWRRYPGARLVLIGRDTSWGGGESMGRRLNRMAGAHRDRLTLAGNQPPERLFPAVAAADVVVLPSRWESFSLAALESMALGKPTVVSRVGGLTEFVEDERNGLVVPPGDAPALAHALTRLLDEDGAALRARLGEQAARTAEDFDVTPVTRRHVAYFEEMAGGTGAQAGSRRATMPRMLVQPRSR
jgi:glycosyltransferase involved in cell wall biosynthesis